MGRGTTENLKRKCEAVVCECVCVALCPSCVCISAGGESVYSSPPPRLQFSA